MRWSSTAGALLLITLMTPLGLGVAQASQGGDDNKVTLCHRTNAENNPYVEITIDKAAVFKRGHDTHDEGPVWQPGFKEAGKRWGDIIPPFEYYASPQDQRDNELSRYAGLNYTDAGKAILDNDCEVAQEEEPQPAGSIDGECIEDGTETGRFVVSGTLDDDGAENVSFRLRLSVGEPIALDGDSYEVTLTAPPGTKVWLQAMVGDGDWVDIDGPVTVSTCGPPASFGKIKIKKEMEGDPIGTSTEFTVRVDCTGLGYDQNVVLNPANNWVNTTDDIPTGTECTLTEVKVPDGWNPEGITPDKVVVGTGEPQQVTAVVENKRRTGRVTITKRIEGDAPGAGTSFTVRLDCEGTDYDQTAVLHAGNDWTVTYAGIPSGITCSVSETEIPDGWVLKSIEPSGNFVIDSYESVDVEVTNGRNLGKILIVKEMDGDPIGTDTDFAVLVTCDDPVYQQEFELTKANNWEAETELLPDGTECFVEEIDVPNGWNPEGIETPDERTDEGTGPVKVIVRSGGTGVVTATVTNERRTGRVEVIKRFEGDPAPAGTTFTVELDCPGSKYDETGVLKGPDWTWVSRAIPSGLTCTVTETGIPAGWELVTIKPSSVVIDSYDVVTVEVTNKRTPPPTTGAISVTKVIQGDPTGASTPFTFSVDCPGTAYDQTLTIDVGSGTSATKQTGQIPTGTTCTVTEATTPGWNMTSVVPAGGVVAVGGTVTFTNSRVTTPQSGTLGIAKSVSPVAGGGTVVTFGDTLTYTLTVTATGNKTQPNVVVTDYVPGFDPARPQSGKTTYVPGSATCVGAGTCTVTEPGADGLITWKLGDMAGGTSRQVTFKVTINDVAADPGEVVAVDILNAGAVKSDVTPTVPSNEVLTTLTKALPVKEGKPETKPEKEGQPEAQPRVLPRTGSGVSLGATVALGGVLLLTGLVLLAAARPTARTRAQG